MTSERERADAELDLEEAAVRRRLDPERAALVVIDVQHDFCHPDGRQARQGKDVGRLVAPLAQLERLIGAARARRVPVIVVRTEHGPSSDHPNWLDRHADPDRVQSCAEGSWGAEFHSVSPEVGDVVITKHRYGAFTRTDLDDQLRSLGRDSLLLTGFTTATCVESTLRQAVDLDHLVTLVADACGAYTEEQEQRTAAMVRSGFGVVVTTDRVFSSWQNAEVVTS